MCSGLIIELDLLFMINESLSNARNPELLVQGLYLPCQNRKAGADALQRNRFGCSVAHWLSQAVEVFGSHVSLSLANATVLFRSGQRQIMQSSRPMGITVLLNDR